MDDDNECGPCIAVKLFSLALFLAYVVAVAMAPGCQHNLPLRVNHNLPPTICVSIEHADAAVQ